MVVTWKTQSSAEAAVNITVKQTNNGAVHSKGEICFSKHETDHSYRTNQGKRGKMLGNQLDASVKVRVGGGVIGRQ